MDGMSLASFCQSREVLYVVSFDQHLIIMQAISISIRTFIILCTNAALEVGGGGGGMYI